MQLTKKSAVKLSDSTLITYLLSSLCNCTVCKCQELALNKAPVLLTTPNSLLLYIVGDRRDVCLQNCWKLCYCHTLSLAKACSAYRIASVLFFAVCPHPETNLLRIYINFQLLETTETTVGLKTTSVTDNVIERPLLNKCLEALKVNWDWSFHTSVSKWPIKSGQIVWSSFDEERSIFCVI